MGFTLTDQHKEDLVKVVTKEEVEVPIFSLNTNKVPGHYGYNAHFFKSMWHEVARDLVLSVQSFFCAKKLLQNINCCSLTLIPKSSNPTSLIHLPVDSLL